jgi:hypothetical protein
MEGSPRFEGGFQIVNDEPGQAHRMDERSLAGTGSWRCLLHQKRYRTQIKCADKRAVVDRATKTGKVFLLFLAVPCVLPLVPQARFAPLGDFARRVLACSGLRRAEVASATQAGT